jgi:hypothetical protein
MARVKVCELQHACVKYKRSDNLPPNNDVRDKYPCQKFIDSNCEMYLHWSSWQGYTIACRIKKK